MTAAYQPDDGAPGRPDPAGPEPDASPTDPFAAAGGDPGAPTPGSDGVESIHVESLLADLERVTQERESHLQDLQRLTAEFANFRKQSGRRHQEIIDQAAAGIVEKLLPVLDACEAALAQGATDVAPIRTNLLEVLTREGLSAIADPGEEFDPTRHEAVIHEAGDDAVPVVAEVMRSGYSWNGRTIRPAMVKVRG